MTCRKCTALLLAILSLNQALFTDAALASIAGLVLGATNAGMMIGTQTEKCGVFRRDLCKIRHQVQRGHTELRQTYMEFLDLQDDLNALQETLVNTLELNEHLGSALDYLGIYAARCFEMKAHLLKIPLHKSRDSLKIDDLLEDSMDKNTPEEWQVFSARLATFAIHAYTFGVTDGKDIVTSIINKRKFQSNIKDILGDIAELNGKMDMRIGQATDDIPELSERDAQKVKVQIKQSRQLYKIKIRQYYDTVRKYASKNDLRFSKVFNEVSKSLPADMIVPHRDPVFDDSTNTENIDTVEKLADYAKSQYTNNELDDLNNRYKIVDDVDSIDTTNPHKLTGSKAKWSVKSSNIAKQLRKPSVKSIFGKGSLKKGFSIASLVWGFASLGATIGFGVHHDTKQRKELLKQLEDIENATQILKLDLIPAVKYDLLDVKNVIEDVIQDQFKNLTEHLNDGVLIMDEFLPDMTLEAVMTEKAFSRRNLDCSSLKEGLCKMTPSQILDQVSRMDLSADELGTIQHLVLAIIEHFNYKLKASYSFLNLLHSIGKDLKHGRSLAEIKNDIDFKCFERKFLFITDNDNVTHECPDYKLRDVACLAAYVMANFSSGIRSKSDENTLEYRCTDLRPYNDLQLPSTTCPWVPEFYASQEVTQEVVFMIWGFLYYQGSQTDLAKVKVMLRGEGYDLEDTKVMCAIKMAFPEWTEYDGYQLPN